MAKTNLVFLLVIFAFELTGIVGIENVFAYDPFVCLRNSHWVLVLREVDIADDGIIEEAFIYTHDSNKTHSELAYSVFPLYIELDYDPLYTYFYNSRGDLTKIELMSKNVGFILQVWIFTYSEGGNLTKCESYLSDNGSVDHLHTYTYDSNGNKNKCEMDFYNDGTVDNTTTYFYDNDGKIAKSQEFSHKNGIIDRVHTYTYDDNGNLAKKVVDGDNDGTVDFSVTYTWKELSNPPSNGGGACFIVFIPFG